MCKTLLSSLRIVDEGMEAVLEYNDLLDKVEAAVNNLNDLDKRILWLYVNLGSYRAVGKEIGIPWESSYRWIRIVAEQVRKSVLGEEVTRKKYSTSKGQRKLGEYVKRA